MPIRTVSAAGDITNTGSVTSVFLAKLIISHFDSNENLIEVRAVRSARVELGPGQRSSQLQISHSIFMRGGEAIVTYVSLDIVSPASRPQVAISATVSYTEPVEVHGLKGDLNDDGKVNELDLTALEIYVATGELPFATSLSDEEIFWRADVNGDGKVNEIDFTALEILLGEA